MSKDPALFLVSLNGSLMADRAAELKGLLASALSRSSNVAVDLSLVEEFDATALQLFYAASREAARAGKRFGFYGELKPSLAKRLKNGGFLTRDVSGAAELDEALVSFHPKGA